MKPVSILAALLLAAIPMKAVEPVINPDSTVTFRVSFPDAEEVILVSTCNTNKGLATGKMKKNDMKKDDDGMCCLLYTSPSPRDRTRSRMPSSA